MNGKIPFYNYLILQNFKVQSLALSSSKKH